MRYAIHLTMALILSMMVFINLPASAEDMMSYDDESGDVEYTGSESEHKDDIDVISMTIDQSDDPIIMTMTVVGDIVGDYGTDGSEGTNSYVLGIDLDGDEDYAEINVKIMGLFAGTENYVTISSETAIEPLTEDEYDITGSTFTVEFDRSHLGTYTEILDFTGSNTQTLGTNMGFDYINYNFGDDDQPYPGEPSTDDDDTTDDDTTDDDSNEGEEEEGSGVCGSVLMGLVFLSLILVVSIAGYMKKRRKE